MDEGDGRRRMVTEDGIVLSCKGRCTCHPHAISREHPPPGCCMCCPDYRMCPDDRLRLGRAWNPHFWVSAGRISLCAPNAEQSKPTETPEAGMSGEPQTVADLCLEAARRYETDEEFHARVYATRMTLEHTGVSERQVAWILHIGDQLRRP